MAYTTINKSGDYFNTKLYTGNGTDDTAITGVGFQPDWLWIKERSSTSHHNLQDAVRGVTKQLISNNTNAEETSTSKVKSFDSNGFTLGTSGAVNENSQTYAAWNWKANGQGSSNTDGSINTTYTSVNTTAGFSISSYTGNGTAGATVGHGLGAVPKMIIIKQYSSNGGTENWVVYHASLGNTKRLSLNLTEEETTDSAVWNNTTPTSSVFSLGNSDKSNNNTVSYIAYCFAEKTGYSKFSSYVGNNNNDGSFIYTGFAPSFVMVKNTQTARDWMMFDNKRTDGNPNLVNKYLIANGGDTEGSNSTTGVDFLSNGFKCRNTFGSVNHAETYIYMAFASAPLVGSNNIPATAR